MVADLEDKAAANYLGQSLREILQLEDDPASSNIVESTRDANTSTVVRGTSLAIGFLMSLAISQIRFSASHILSSAESVIGGTLLGIGALLALAWGRRKTGQATDEMDSSTTIFLGNMCSYFLFAAAARVSGACSGPAVLCFLAAIPSFVGNPKIKD